MQYIGDIFETISDFWEHHKILSRLCAVILLVLILVCCWNIGKKHENNIGYVDIPESEEEFEAYFPYLALTELDLQTDMTDVKTIDLTGCDGVCEITEGGNFRLTGELDGTVHIFAKEQNVHLFLDNASIRSAIGPAVYCEEADKLIVTLVSDTQNSISDSGKYRADEEIEACIYSNCDMTLNGNGSLTVTGLYKDAIRSKDIVKIIDGKYEIKCKRSGVHGNDGIYICGGNFTVSSEKNGFKTTKSGAEGRGNLIIGGGDFTVIAGRYTFLVEKADLYVYDCHILERSIVDTYKVTGQVYVRKGCIEQ